MEQNNTVFTVICNDEKYLKESLDWYNSIYQTNFRIRRFILDEVNFAEIEVHKFELKDIFNIGYAFGAKEQKLREQGEIDW
jgi:hypothetical protein